MNESQVLNILMTVAVIFTAGTMIITIVLIYRACTKKINGRKFKLIKIYPNSPTLNTIVVEKLNGYFDNNFSKAFDKEFLTQWPEYWKEIK